ncbi:MAG: hypothetical protein Kow0069_10580 [Promethearchaeota archaeon]
MDFIRGVAMVGVLLFHVLNVAYAQGADAVKGALGGEGSVPGAMVALGLVLVYFGLFNGMFVLISGMVNVITMDGQWKRATAKGKDAASTAKRIFTGQFVRGTFTILMGVLSEWVLNGVLLDAIVGEEVTATDFLGHLWQINILQTIGLSTIICAAVYLVLRVRGTKTGKLVKTLALLGVVVLAIRPFAMAALAASPSPGHNFWSGWETRTPATNFAYFFLAPLVGRLTPLIPYLACGFFGTSLGVALTSGGLTKQFIKKSLLVGVALLAAAVVALVFELAVFDLGLELDTARSFATFLSAFGGEVIATVLLLAAVDYRGKTEAFAKKTVFFRRFALVTLTLWNMQWVMIFPLFAFDAATGWGVLEGALNGYQLMLLLALITAFWHMILRAWERADFKYSFEWLANKVIAPTRDVESDRLKVRRVLYGREEGGEPEDDAS